ncbi:ROK family protein [[Acholeplasma] multilocale]|uniref:ROK family protein n=1 Tax=[Acholeplasma] multilocale TaxID=264638 RepID=UPI0003FB5C12|nr:ROK family protein [[Acholeplasma] multilocale]
MKLCFDIGGMSVKAAVFDGQEMVNKKDYVYGKAINNVELLEILNNALKEAIEKYPQIDGIGISSAGVIDTETTQVHGRAAIEDIKYINFRRDLETSLPVFAENDAFAAAQSQIAFNKEVEGKNTIVMIIGTGLGGALILDDKLYKGSNLLGGSFGFIAHDINFATLSIGHNTATTGMLIKGHHDRTGELLTGKEIVEGYNKDEQKKISVDKFVEDVAKVVISANAVADAELVLIGGGISQSDLILDLVTKRIDAFLDVVGEPYKRKFAIQRCVYAQDANLYGALALTK